MFEMWIVLALLSAVFTGLREILSKKILNHKVEVNQLIFFNYLLLFIVITLFFLNKVEFLAFFKIWDLFLLKALSLFLFQYLFFKLLENHEISLISPLNNLSPIFLIILSSVFLGEVLTLIQFLGILIIVLATYILEINFHHHKKTEPHRFQFKNLKKLDWKTIGVVFAMLFSVSICNITDKMILNDFSVFTNLFFSGAIILFAVLFYNIFNKNLVRTFKLIKKEPVIILISLFTNISIYFMLLALAIPLAMVSLIIPIKRTSTLFSSLFGGILFHEKNLTQKFIAIILMLFGIFLISL